MLVGLPGAIGKFRLYAARLGGVLARGVRRDTGEIAVSLAVVQPFPTVLDWWLAVHFGAQWEFDSHGATPGHATPIYGWAHQVRPADPRWVIDMLVHGYDDALILYAQLWKRCYSPGRVRRERNHYVDFITSATTLAVGPDLPAPHSYLDGCSLNQLLSLDESDMVRNFENNFLPGLATGGAVPEVPPDSLALSENFAELEYQSFREWLRVLEIEDEEEGDEGSPDYVGHFNNLDIQEEGEEDENEGEGFEWF